MTGNRLRILGLIILVLLVVSKSEGIVAPSKVTQVTYVYDDTPVPLAVRVAFNELNREGINANPIDVDSGAEQHAIAKTKALETGVPVLVVQAGDKVTKAVKDIPTTPEAVIEAVK